MKQVVPVPLPPWIASAIPGIRWPLGPSSSPPLHFKPLERMSEIRRSSSMSPSSNPSVVEHIVHDVVGSVARLNAASQASITHDGERHGSSTSHSENDYVPRIAIALVLLGHGYTDEAHALVSPLSWPKETPFGYGHPVATPSDVLAMASYAHSLVHRREGFNVGEFGMSGLANANYWASATLRSGGEETLPFRRVRDAVHHIARQSGPEAEAWFRETVVEESKGHEDYWEPRALHDLCGRVMKSGTENCGTGLAEVDSRMRDFAERAAEAELRVLLAHALRHAGFECGNDDFLRV